MEEYEKNPHAVDSSELADIIASRDSKRFYGFCIEKGYSPQSELEEGLVQDYLNVQEIVGITERIIKTPASQRPKTSGPLVSICLGGGNRGDKFLEEQRYATELLEKSLSIIYPYLNFSETLSIIDTGRKQLEENLKGRDFYGAISEGNRYFFPNFNVAKKNLSENQQSTLKKLDIYGSKKTLASRISAIPEDVVTRAIQEIKNPSVKGINTFIKGRMRGQEKKYQEKCVKIRGREISKMVNDFSREYHKEFI